MPLTKFSGGMGGGCLSKAGGSDIEGGGHLERASGSGDNVNGAITEERRKGRGKENNKSESA